MKRGAILCLLLLVLVGCSDSKKDIKKNNKDDEVIEKDKSVRFMAVGDNLIHGAIYHSCYSNNSYNFDYTFENIKEDIKNADIAYINQETILGGKALGLSHYPMFNSPEEVAESINKYGFDWVNMATNHTLDKGEVGVLNAINTFRKYPNITTTGAHDSLKDSEKLKVIERNGIKVGVLSYTYGTNGITVPSGKDYLVDLIDKDKIANDISKLKKVSDVIVVNMHWGAEDNFIQNEEQEELAQFLADQGVLVVIGMHPHVIQPAEYINGKDGNKTLVYYSLGNYISAQDDKRNMIGAMAKWDIIKDGKTGKYRVDNAQFIPTITHYDIGYKNFTTYTFDDYNETLASKHHINSIYGASYFTKQYVNDKVAEVMNGVSEDIKVAIDRR